MDSQALFDRYFDALLDQPRVWERYSNSTLWTREATRALVATGEAVSPTGKATALGYQDQYGRSEYLTLDVCITDPNTWGPPLFIAEHENAPWKAKVEYCAWKLLATVAQQRVLVAHYAAKTDLPTAQVLEDAVRGVCRDNAGKDIVLIIGDYDKRPTSAEELRSAYDAPRIVGVHA